MGPANSEIRNIPIYTMLNQLLKDIIIGTLLGDAKMEFSQSGKARFIYELSSKHKSYLLSVHELFANHVDKEPQEYLHFDKRTGKSTTSIRFSTITSELFYPYASMFYTRVPQKDGTSFSRRVVKVLPVSMSELLTPRALAY